MDNRSETSRISSESTRIKIGDLLYSELSYKVVGCVFIVWKELGPAFKESVYQKALAEEFSKHNIIFQSQRKIPISYNKKEVGKYVPDFVIEDKILIELKALPFLSKLEEKQAWYYLKGSSYKLLLLVNFGGKRLNIKRWVYDKARRAE